MRFFQIGRETVCQNCYEAYPVIGIELDMEQVERPEEIRCAYCLADELKKLRENQRNLVRHIRHLQGHLQSVARDEYTEATLNAMARMDGVAALLRYERLYPETRVQT